MVRIAIIDDNVLARRTLTGLIRGLGHQATEVPATSLYEMLRELRENRPDLLMVDLQMPECPGLSLIRGIREDHVLRDLRVMVVSAFGDAETVQALARLGIDGFITKPPDAGEVTERLAVALDHEPREKDRVFRVMVVHPRPEALLQAHQLLDWGGYRVLSLVPTALMDALGILVSHPPDLLVCGLGEGAFKGLTLLRALREDPRLKSLRVLVLEEGGVETPTELLATFRVDGVVPFPLQPTRFQELVKASLLALVDANL